MGKTYGASAGPSLHSSLLLAAVALLAAAPGLAQKTSSSTLNISGMGTLSGAYAASGSGQVTISPLGGATLSIKGSQALSVNLQPTGTAQLTFTFAFNSTDRFSAAFSYAEAPSVTVCAPISGGAGAYAGATGSVTLVLLQGTSFRKWKLRPELDHDRIREHHRRPEHHGNLAGKFCVHYPTDGQS
jgi:hypothetical protein